MNEKTSPETLVELLDVYVAAIKDKKICPSDLKVFLAVVRNKCIPPKKFFELAKELLAKEENRKYCPRIIDRIEEVIKTNPDKFLETLVEIIEIEKRNNPERYYYHQSISILRHIIDCGRITDVGLMKLYEMLEEKGFRGVYGSRIKPT